MMFNLRFMSPELVQFLSLQSEKYLGACGSRRQKWQLEITLWSTPTIRWDFVCIEFLLWSAPSGRDMG